MNDPNKAIDVNLSSLLSLKAELLRKQAEVGKTKATRIKDDEYTSSGKITSGSGVVKRDKKPKAVELEEVETGTIYEHEDTELLEKSQRVLQAKSKFYDRMSRSGGKLNSDDNCLVLFNRKRQEEKSDCVPIERDESMDKSISSDSESSDAGTDNEKDNFYEDHEEDWVEYTDCLGRTRKCLREDLKAAKERDAELAASMPERLDQTKANWMIDTKGSEAIRRENDEDDGPIGPLPPASIYSDGCSMMSKHDEQRANWEKKEQENLGKEDVHYQDVFFDEARQHGVGYYAFSTDEEERRRQQNELEEMRLKTIEEQEHRDAMRAQREKIIAERVRAAKNRQRARLGLPPLEEDVDDQKKVEAEKKETKEERRERKKLEKRRRKLEKAEKERELEREKHIRPWDREKDGMPKSSSDGFEPASSDETEWQYKAEREPMSQEQWNERKRSERNPDFAPMPEKQTKPKPKRTNFTSMPPPPPPPMANVAQYNMVPPPVDNEFATYQSTKRERMFRKRNYVENSEAAESNVLPFADRQGAAIPPPVNWDNEFKLPVHAKRAKSATELERSIEAGLRFLRDNCDKDTMSTKSSWTAKADY